LSRMGASLVSSVWALWLFVAMFGVVLNVPLVWGIGTIYIRADGSIDPLTAPITTVDKVTYTLTDNIASSSDGIIVERDNIIIDGDGYVLRGPGYTGTGVSLAGRSNVTIKNTRITAFYYGTWLSSSNNNSISGNDITADIGDGIRLKSSSSNSISGNNIANNEDGH